MIRRRSYGKLASDSDNYENKECVICGSGANEDVMLLCDMCDRGFHTYCLNMKSIPRGSWYCPKCMLSLSKNRIKQKSYKVSPKHIVKQRSRSRSRSRSSSRSRSRSSSRSRSRSRSRSPNSTKKKYVHIYLRVSTKGQNEPEYGRVGQDTQENAIKEFCKKHNLDILTITKEVGSAYKNKTPELDKLIKEVEPGDIIVVYSVDRFSRSLKAGLNKLNKLHDKDVIVWSVLENVKSTNGKFEDLIKQGEEYSKIAGHRLKSYHSKVRAKRGFTGRIKPFGYYIIMVDGVRMLEKNPIEQSIMADVKTLYNNISNKEELLDILGDKYPNYEWSSKMVLDIVNDTIVKKYNIYV